MTKDTYPEYYWREEDTQHLEKCYYNRQKILCPIFNTEVDVKTLSTVEDGLNKKAVKDGMFIREFNCPKCNRKNVRHYKGKR